MRHCTLDEPPCSPRSKHPIHLRGSWIPTFGTALKTRFGSRGSAGQGQGRI